MLRPCLLQLNELYEIIQKNITQDSGGNVVTFSRQTNKLKYWLSLQIHAGLSDHNH